MPIMHHFFQILGTFQTVASTVKTALEESLLALLQPKRQVDVLREALEAKRQGRPYVVTFCGVNGVGKSTNLAKVKALSIYYSCI
jgi:signal recognition particle receptor subunit alpha